MRFTPQIKPISTTVSIFERCLLLSIAMLLLLSTAACGRRAPPEDEGFALNVSLLNYTDEPIGVVYVDGSWASGVGGHRGGSGVAGGYGVPTKWHPGIMVKIEWQPDELYQRDYNGLYERMVEVPPYIGKFPGLLWVAFFPNDVIKVFATSYGPGHPDFPDLKQTPGDICKADAACRKKFYGES